MVGRNLEQPSKRRCCVLMAASGEGDLSFREQRIGGGGGVATGLEAAMAVLVASAAAARTGGVTGNRSAVHGERFSHVEINSSSSARVKRAMSKSGWV